MQDPYRSHHIEVLEYIRNDIPFPIFLPSTTIPTTFLDSISKHLQNPTQAQKNHPKHVFNRRSFQKEFSLIIRRKRRAILQTGFRGERLLLQRRRLRPMH